MDGQNFNNDFNQQDTYTYQEPVETPKASGMSIAALVLGIIGILAGCCIPLVGIICSIVGIILGVVGNKQVKTGLGIAGLVVSIIALVLSIISWAAYAVIMMSAGSYLESMGITY